LSNTAGKFSLDVVPSLMSLVNTLPVQEPAILSIPYPDGRLKIINIPTIISNTQFFFYKMIEPVHIKIGKHLAAEFANGQAATSRTVKQTLSYQVTLSNLLYFL
jgi:hypothetical protein